MSENLDLEKLVKTYVTNEENNAHCDNLVLLATNFGSEEDLALAKSFKDKFDAGVKRNPSERTEYDHLSERLWQAPPVDFLDIYFETTGDPEDPDNPE